jgi:hypothetical protein
VHVSPVYACNVMQWKEVSHETLVLRFQHVSFRFSGFLLASPCLCSVAVSMVEAAKLLIFEGVQTSLMSFYVAGVARRDTLACLQMSVV